MAGDAAILPEFTGPEEVLGKGEVYDAPRAVVDALGMQRVASGWSRSLSRSCGADDGLWLTYPKLAEGLARREIRAALGLGAEAIVTDSLLCARYLSEAAGAEDSPIDVLWLPEAV